MGNLHTKGSKVSFVIGEFPDFLRTYSLIRAFSTTEYVRVAQRLENQYPVRLHGTG